MSDCFVLYLLLTCMKKKTSGADKFTNNNKGLCGTDQFCIPRQKYVPDGKYYRGCLLSADPGTGAYG